MQLENGNNIRFVATPLLIAIGVIMILFGLGSKIGRTWTQQIIIYCISIILAIIVSIIILKKLK